MNRYKNGFEYGFGSEWASLTNEAIEILLNNEKWIKKHFSYTHCCDEIYKQTVLKNSNVESSSEKNMRLIIWESGDGSKHPYIFKENDYEMIKKSDCLFARKFSSDIDSQIINKIYEDVKCVK